MCGGVWDRRSAGRQQGVSAILGLQDCALDCTSSQHSTRKAVDCVCVCIPASLETTQRRWCCRAWRTRLLGRGKSLMVAASAGRMDPAPCNTLHLQH